VEPAEPDVPDTPEDPDALDAPEDPDALGDLEDPGVPGDSDRPDDGERTGLADGDADGPAVDPDVADPDVADELGWVGELVASWVQAAMITRLLAGSALPPTPLRSTK
jgi:hypothetical protein